LNFLSSRAATSKKAKWKEDAPKGGVTIQFGEIITDRTQVEERIRRAQRAVLSPSVDHTVFLDEPEGECPRAELTFTTDYVQIEISDCNLTNLSFFDLPGAFFRFTLVPRLTPLYEGLIANAEAGKEGDIQLVENLVSDYISRDSCLILLTIACECEVFPPLHAPGTYLLSDDFRTQKSYQLAKKYDPIGARTVGRSFCPVSRV
jgi:hypothetical protein